MKKIEIKLKKPENLDMAKVVPRLLLAAFLTTGVAIVAFGYFSFTRPPEESVVLEAKKELEEASVEFDREKVLNLFDSSYDVSKIKEQPYKTKNPFLKF